MDIPDHAVCLCGVLQLLVSDVAILQKNAITRNFCRALHRSKSVLVGVDEEAIKEGTERDPILIAKYQQVFYQSHNLLYLVSFRLLYHLGKIKQDTYIY